MPPLLSQTLTAFRTNVRYGIELKEENNLGVIQNDIEKNLELHKKAGHKLAY